MVALLKKNSIFKRQSLKLAWSENPNNSAADSSNTLTPRAQAELVYSKKYNKSGKLEEYSKECTALVINSSQEMAKEITLQLTLSIPGCSIMYAPTIELAKWILNRRKIDIVVSCPILPDGGISRLKDILGKMETPPDLVVMGNINIKSAELLNGAGYEFATLRRIGTRQTTTPASYNRRNTDKDLSPINSSVPEPPSFNRTIQSLGADIRNDLNNPLQEIVAMVFVAKAASEISNTTDQALAAIDRAAKNMAQVVNKLEDKIRNAVEGG